MKVMISSWSERMLKHTGIETRPRLLWEAAVGRKPDGAMTRGGRRPTDHELFFWRRSNDGI